MKPWAKASNSIKACAKRELSKLLYASYPKVINEKYTMPGSVSSLFTQRQFCKWSVTVIRFRVPKHGTVLTLNYQKKIMKLHYFGQF